MRYEDFRRRLVEAALQTPGDTTPEVRRAALERATAPGSLAPYVSNVALHAYKITDTDVAQLRHAGHSDDSLFEITVAAAVGAALYRLDRGMAALRGEEPPPD
ncbi:MAG TPA: hypothetical protein VN803_14210 [Gemmatimonadales bacterium]|nr:hypothetical protein [Gemmatimonadales bacterium]